MTLSSNQIEQFVEEGFVRIDDAFPRGVADAAREILWRETGCDPNDRATWTKPVIRVGEVSAPVFAEAANTARLHSAFDALVGKERWLPRQRMISFPVRFPHPVDPGDAGWHVDASFPPKEYTDDFLHWRVNYRSRDRLLLMLFLFSDAGENDAPTRLRIGSHRDVARLLVPHGEDGLNILELAGEAAVTENSPVTLATGAAGTVYLCHPFLVHAAQMHRGKTRKNHGAAGADPARADRDGTRRRKLLPRRARHSRGD
ncbi:MAG TPA: phytanoyl-CoA dioxygenase family protein [Rhizomicrobium sp.]